MSESRTPIPFVTYDADGRIDMDLPCRKCGYNLRTLRDDRQCPECGASIHDSARLAWLCQHDPAWLRRLATATVWIAIAMTCFAPMPLLFMWAVVWPSTVHGLPFGTALLMVIAGYVAGLVGFLRVTTPPHRGGIRRSRVRRVARWTMAAGLASLPLSLLMPHAYVVTWWLGGCILLLEVGALAMLAYACALAAKIPEARLVKQIRIVSWRFALCFLLAQLGTVLLWIDDRLGLPFASYAALSVLLVAVATGLFVLSIWTLPLLVWYRHRFREALTMAQQRTDAQAA
jgi:hypothetical protein